MQSPRLIGRRCLLDYETMSIGTETCSSGGRSNRNLSIAARGNQAVLGNPVENEDKLFALLLNSKFKGCASGALSASRKTLYRIHLQQ